MARGASQNTPTITAETPRHVARRGGFEYNRQSLDRGQVLQLAGLPNDEALVRLGYVRPMERGETTYTCAVCGQDFVGISERTAHGNLRHRDRDLSPDEEDALDERLEKQQEQIAPLYLDKTKAAQAAA